MQGSEAWLSLFADSIILEPIARTSVTLVMIVPSAFASKVASTVYKVEQQVYETMLSTSFGIAREIYQCC